ncbi:amino acid ABC transporter permease [Roseovarius phycicola]|uniref:ABC transporter permease subunit n=1 Tax=Roseovarius phycicola TaxID=3080976 RepID=A0ABZ2HGY8_9RHOB
MTTMTDPPQESFRLSMLLNDTRYRSYTFQFIALIALISLIAYLGSNLVQNLRAAGLNISYEFLGEPAGYDINQRLIEYDSQSSHWRASIVGILNTLLVAFLACVTATILGVAAGVLRLSNNWLVRKLMAIYVEAFRNVPVLIWIIIIFTVMTAVLPSPRAFRGEDATSSMLLDSLAFTSQGVFVPGLVFGTGGLLVVLTLLASIAGMVFYGKYRTKKLYDEGKELPGWVGWAILIVPTILVYQAFSLTAGQVENRIIVPSEIAAADVSLEQFGERLVTDKTNINYCVVTDSTASALGKKMLLGLPAMELTNPDAVKMKSTRFFSMDDAKTAFAAGSCNMLVVPASEAANFASSVETGAVALATNVKDNAPIAFDTPYLANFRFTDGITVRGSLIALWFALAIYTGAFIAENVRAGIQAISKGQTEAAASLGLRPGRIMNLVVLPQALRVIIPPLISQYLNITKNSSLAIAVGYMDITGTLGGITLNQTGRAIECVLLLMLFYLVISLSISGVMNIYNNAVKLKER